jgi:hypothetical protein
MYVQNCMTSVQVSLKSTCILVDSSAFTIPSVILASDGDSNLSDAELWQYTSNMFHSSFFEPCLLKLFRIRRQHWVALKAWAQVQKCYLILCHFKLLTPCNACFQHKSMPVHVKEVQVTSLVPSLLSWLRSTSKSCEISQWDFYPMPSHQTKQDQMNVCHRVLTKASASSFSPSLTANPSEKIGQRQSQQMYSLQYSARNIRKPENIAMLYKTSPGSFVRTLHS